MKMQGLIGTTIAIVLFLIPGGTAHEPVSPVSPEFVDDVIAMVGCLGNDSEIGFLDSPPPHKDLPSGDVIFFDTESLAVAAGRFLRTDPGPTDKNGVKHDFEVYRFTGLIKIDDEVDWCDGVPIPWPDDSEPDELV